MLEDLLAVSAESSAGPADGKLAALKALPAGELRKKISESGPLTSI